MTGGAGGVEVIVVHLYTIQKLISIEENLCRAAHWNEGGIEGAEDLAKEHFPDLHTVTAMIL